MTNSENSSTLTQVLADTRTAWQTAAADWQPEFDLRETGRVMEIGQGIVRVDGLPGVQSEELVRFPGNRLGLAFNLDENEVGIILLDHGEGIEAGNRVYRTGRVLDVPVGDAVLGRVIDPNGRPLDGRGKVQVSERRAAEQPAPPIMNRAPVVVPLQTGIKVIDSLIPIGRGQRELIIGDRQTGKTAIALDAIINQRGQNIVCFYCAIGQRSSALSSVVSDLREHGAMEYTTVVATTGEDPAGRRYIAPYAATSMAEHFMKQGRDVLIVYDDLTHHARAYRELSLLLRRPPGREAFPGDIFYLHSRLLERATHLRPEHGGGSLTALPIVETQAQNISAYIPTNLISITDGQIYLSPQLFRQGILPAIDVGKSVSRVGGKAQLPAYRTVTGDLRLSYSQFEELERFSRYGARLEEEQRHTLEHGRRVREIFKQPQYKPIPVTEQIAALIAVSEGLLDTQPNDRVAELEQAIRGRVSKELGDVLARIKEGKKLTDEDRAAIRTTAEHAIAESAETFAGSSNGNHSDTAKTD